MYTGEQNHEEIIDIIVNKPENSVTLKVNDYIMEIFRKSATLENMREENLFEIADYLKVNSDQLKGPFLVNDSLKCSNCKKNLTFLDIIKSAPHPKEKIKNILCGKEGNWITIIGKQDNRIIKCTNCGKSNTIINLESKKNNIYCGWVYACSQF
jgi:transcription elongation factor Elf1